jgi:predicted kinase
MEGIKAVKLTCMRGYSGSGKSTRAREIAKETGAVVVCRDDLRMMLLGPYWTGKAADEDRVTSAEQAQVLALLSSGTNVVVDATHLNPRYLRGWAKMATKVGADFEVVDVKTLPSICVNRDRGRELSGERFVGEEVIIRQVKQAPMPKWPTITAKPFTVEPVTFNPDLPYCILVDIDGTLAHIPEGGRSPFDYTRVSEDFVDETIKDIVNREYYHADSFIIILSGRDGCREATENWLVYHQIDHHELILRPADAKDDRGNKLPDYQVKYDLFNKHIRPRFNVRYVLDDRQQVVDMWRKVGLKVLQVEPGNF